MPVVTADQVVSLHTYDGVQLYQFLPDGPAGYRSCTWSRALRDVSRCELSLPPIIDAEEIDAWSHWLSVWDGERATLLWTGPVLKARGNSSGVSIAAVDHSALLARQRNPMTKRWEAADPADVAGELWSAMVEQQGLNTAPIVRPDPEGERFDFHVVTDAQMLDQTVNDLAQRGLRWSVVSGTPILGPVGVEPFTTLDDTDVLGDVDVVRDGTAMVNDVLVRGPDNIARARVDRRGLNLQSIQNIDSMFAVSNAQRAANLFARHSASVRTMLEVPGGTVLHQDAPVSIDELMPSARFVMAARGIRQLMELRGVEVTRDEDGASVSITPEPVVELPELAELAALQQGRGL